ncbi:MAG: hypothetical protein AAFN81_01920 [Bacteroidota bacterium]
MADFLYTDFLENKRIYNLTQAYWGKLLTSVLKQHGYAYTSYINQIQGGKKEYDGNPIFSAYIPEARRAIRVIQVSPDEEGDDLSAWIDTIELNEKTNSKQTEELVIDVKLSRKVRTVAKDLMAKWVANQLDSTTLDEIIEESTDH